MRVKRIPSRCFMVSESYLRRVILETGFDLVKNMNEILSRKQALLDLTAGYTDDDIRPVGFDIPIDPYNLRNPPLVTGMPPASSVSNDANTLLPLLFAAHPDLVPNYRRMAAMDDEKRTYSALEHKFRNWRQAGKKILAEKGEPVESEKTGASSPAGASRPKPSASLRGGGDAKKTSRVKPRVEVKVEEDVEEDEEAVGDGAGATKASKNKKMNTTKKVSGAAGKNGAAPSSPALDMAASPSGKGKKGTAQVVKKAKAKPRELLVTDDEDEEEDDEVEEEADTAGKGKAKSRRRSKSILKPMTAKKAAKRQRESLEEDKEIDRAAKARKMASAEQEEDVAVEDEAEEESKEKEGDEGKEGEGEELEDMKFEMEE